MWNKQPELYRGKYYARKGNGAQTRRKSLATDRLDVAVMRLADLQRMDTTEPITVKDIFALYRAEKENKHNRLNYIWRVLGPHFEHYRPDQITRELCRHYIEKRRVKPGTVRRELGALRAALRWHNPNTPAVFYFPPAPPPQTRHLSRDEVERLLAACQEPHIKLYIVLAICTAARKSALLELKWENIDFKRGLIDFGNGDGNKKRSVAPINETARSALLEAYKGRLTDFVIEFRGKSMKDIRSGFKGVAKRAGLEAHPHMLRHTAAVWMAESGVPMSEIAQYLGHTNTRITESTYARYSPDYLRNAARTLELSSIAPHKPALLES